MTDKPWWEKGQHAAAFIRGSAGSSPGKPQEPVSRNEPKLGLHGGPKPPALHRAEIERAAREQAARDKYLSRYLENDNRPDDPTPKLDNSL